MNSFFEIALNRMLKGSFIIWIMVFMTGCATSLTTPLLTTPSTSNLESGTVLNNSQSPTKTPGVVETMPPLAGSPSSNPAFVLRDCQQMAPPAGPVSVPNTGEGESKPGLPSDPVQGLRQALQLANQEMDAATKSTNLNDARAHAEAVVNILVGYWGCWYGNADGNGIVNDPSNGYGVLPASRVQTAAPDTRAAQVQIGWALKVYEQDSSNSQKQIQVILGDIKLWQNNPISGYEQIQFAVQNSDVENPQVTKLDGQAVQAVAWARLILLKAQTIEQANQFAVSGLKNTAEALKAARQIS